MLVDDDGVMVLQGFGSAPRSRENPFMAAELRLRVIATTAAWSRNQHSEETEGAESIGDLEELQRWESALSAATMDMGAQREQEQQQAGEGLGRAQRVRSRMRCGSAPPLCREQRCGSAPPHRNEPDVRMRQKSTKVEQNTEDRIDDCAGAWQLHGGEEGASAPGKAQSLSQAFVGS